MKSPDTLSQVMSWLQKQGYTEDLNRHADNPLWHDPEAFQIDGTYRFEGATNPDDEAILYALSSVRYGIKGVLVNGYGPSANPAVAAITQKIQRGSIMKQMLTDIPNGSI